jgi:inhibitor of cysteine peptidase
MRGPILRALVLLSCAVLVALALVGCTEEPVALTEADAEKAVTLRVEQQLIVTLGSNPSTGYSWVLQMDPEGFLTLDSSGYEPGPQVPGSGGQQRFRFTARRSGRTTLAFTSGRPPEPPVRTIRYLVLVE